MPEPKPLQLKAFRDQGSMEAYWFAIVAGQPCLPTMAPSCLQKEFLFPPRRIALTVENDQEYITSPWLCINLPLLEPLSSLLRFFLER
jgi:hypothetical protein